MRFFNFLFFLSIAFSGCGQNAPQAFVAQKDSFILPLGDTVFTVVLYRYNTAVQPFLVHLHHNEQTADSAARYFLEKEGGSFLTLLNKQERLLSFSVSGRRYTVDPNRMFTALGRRMSLDTLGNYTAEADSAVAHFASAFLALLPAHGSITAVHNNTNNNYSLLSYLPGGIYAGDVKSVYQVPELDIDDFALTTDSAAFEIFKKANLNVVLQNNDTAQDDGSLGYYFGRLRRSYTNIEAQHAHQQEQLRYLAASRSLL